MGRPILAAAAFQAASRLKAGCGQDCPPHYFMKLRAPEALRGQTTRNDGLPHVLEAYQLESRQLRWAWKPRLFLHAVSHNQQSGARQHRQWSEAKRRNDLQEHHQTRDDNRGLT